MTHRARVTRGVALVLGAFMGLVGAEGGALAHPRGDLVAYRWHAESQDGPYQVHPDGDTSKRQLAPPRRSSKSSPSR